MDTSMARRPRASALESRSNRLKLPIRRKPHHFTAVSPGVSLGYRRCQGAGRWVIRVADGHGGSWTKAIGLADDYEDADGENVLTWWEAIERGRRVARGGDTDLTRPATFADALADYRQDLIARGGSVENADRVTHHLAATLASKPVALLTARELARWRDDLLANGVKTATVVRAMKGAKAALNLAARRDARIANRAAWADGLGGLSEDFESRNVQRLDDEQVRAVIEAATAIDASFGAYVHVAAESGARVSQIAKLRVGDLQADNGTPRLMMPQSRKGRGRKPGKIAVPITDVLAAKLKSNRPKGASLLLRTDGRPWQSDKRKDDHAQLWKRAADAAGLPAGTVMYSLRHSAIIRGLLAGIPTRLVAALADTSVGVLERTYSHFITDYAGDIARRGLLTSAAKPVTQAVALAGRKSS
jgi:integrase